MRIERRTVVLVELNPAVGHEQKDVRPCVIVSDPEVAADQRVPLLAVVPITGTAGEVRSPWSISCARSTNNGRATSSTR